LGGFWYKCSAEENREKTNQAAKSPALSLTYLDMENLLIL
jgi:hypothetical protein